VGVAPAMDANVKELEQGRLRDKKAGKRKREKGTSQPEESVSGEEKKEELGKKTRKNQEEVRGIDQQKRIQFRQSWETVKGQPPLRASRRTSIERVQEIEQHSSVRKM